MLRLLALLLAIVIGAAAQSPSIFSNDGTDEFLGTLNSNRFDPNSISNPLGTYGSVLLHPGQRVFAFMLDFEQAFEEIKREVEARQAA